MGHPWRTRVHGGRRLGLDLHRPRALERRGDRAGCLQARRSPPCRSLHGACRAVTLDRGRSGRGLALQDRHVILSNCRTTSPTRSQVRGLARAVLRLRSLSPHDRRRLARAAQCTSEGTIHGRQSTATSRSCGKVRDFVELLPSGSSKRTATSRPHQRRWHAAISIRPAATTFVSKEPGALQVERELAYHVRWSISKLLSAIFGEQRKDLALSVTGNNITI